MKSSRPEAAHPSSLNVGVEVVDEKVIRLILYLILRKPLRG